MSEQQQSGQLSAGAYDYLACQADKLWLQQTGECRQCSSVLLRLGLGADGLARWPRDIELYCPLCSTLLIPKSRS